MCTGPCGGGDVSSQSGEKQLVPSGTINSNPIKARWEAITLGHGSQTLAESESPIQWGQSLFLPAGPTPGGFDLLGLQGRMLKCAFLTNFPVMLKLWVYDDAENHSTGSILRLVSVR